MAGGSANGYALPSVGGSQVINGKGYAMYTPEWYAAQDAEKVRAAKVEGQAAGTMVGQADASKYQTKYPGYQTPPPPTTTGFGSILAGLTGSVAGAGGTTNGTFPNVLGSGASMGGGGGAPGGGGGAPGGAPGGQMGTGYAQFKAPDTTAATDAAFGRAKDQVGLESRGALTGLAGAMAGRGTVGSGVEGRGQQAIIQSGQQQLADTSRQSAITAADLAQKNAELSFSGQLTQRGQDITHGDTFNNQLLTQRGQDITASGQTEAQRTARAELALRALMAQNSQQNLVY